MLVALVFFSGGDRSVFLMFIILGRIIEITGFAILFVSLYDLRRSLTALPLPKKNGVLQIRGLYRFVRHPMYVAVLTLSLGISIVSGSLQKYVIVVGLYILFSFKARYEERLLVAKYSGYKKYMEATPRFIPKFKG